MTTETFDPDLFLRQLEKEVGVMADAIKGPNPGQSNAFLMEKFGVDASELMSLLSSVVTDMLRNSEDVSLSELVTLTMAGAFLGRALEQRRVANAAVE